MNTNDKGRVAELIATAKYISLGYVVLHPINKDGLYDLVIEKDGIFNKIQVKTLNDKGIIYIMNTRSTCHNRNKNILKYYKKGDIDCFVGVDITNNKVFEIPFDKANRNTMSFRKKETKNNQDFKSNFAKDFEI